MRKYINLVLFFLCYSCSNADTKGILKTNESDKQTETISPIEIIENPICLKFQFQNKHPFVLRLTKQNIYVGDGEAIYQFNLKGEFLNKINLPNQLEGYIDFTVYEQKEETFFYTIWNGEISCFNASSTMIYKVAGSGDIVRVDERGIAYTNYQEYDKNKDQVINKIKIIQIDGSNTEYPIKKDLPCVNLEIVDSNIMLHASDGNLYILPLDQNQIEKVYSLQELKDRVWFLGKSGDYYVFRTFDFDKKKDVMHFYDLNLNKVKSEILDVQFKDVVKQQSQNDDFLMDNPSAIMYSFANRKIYYLRNTNGGSCISEIKLPLNVPVEK